MDRQVDARDFSLLEKDRYTFAVLSRILHGDCELILTDHESFVLCHSAAPYPVWLWTPDNISLAEKEKAWQTAQKVRPLAGGFCYNLKYELAEYFIEQARNQGCAADITMNLFAYDCAMPRTPEHTADGAHVRCTEADLDETADIIKRFHDDIGDGFSMDMCRAKAKEQIASRSFFFWRDHSGKAVACCSYKMDGELACIGSVYTLPAYRRKHYAQNLVYQVTKFVSDAGLRPMLYTDADYAASNACYEKIGYELKGKLCTIGLSK